MLPRPSNKKIPGIPVITHFQPPKHGMEAEIINPLDSIYTLSLAIRNVGHVSQIHRPLVPFIDADVLLKIEMNPLKDVLNRHSIFVPNQDWPGKLDVVSNRTDAEFSCHRPCRRLRAIGWKQWRCNEAVPMDRCIRRIPQVPEERRDADNLAPQVWIELTLPSSVWLWIPQPSYRSWRKRRVLKSCYPPFGTFFTVFNERGCNLSNVDVFWKILAGRIVIHPDTVYPWSRVVSPSLPLP